MKKTASSHSKLSQRISLLPSIALDGAFLVWLTRLCLTIIVLLSISACNGLPSTPSSFHTRPTLTSTPTSTLTRTHTPTPTKTPSSTPTPTPTPCVYYDVELDNVRDPRPYGWCVDSHPTFDLVLRNSGACLWPEETKLVLLSENTLDWPESWPIGAIDIGKEITVTVKLTAPSIAQTLPITWQLVGPEGQLIGSEITYTLSVVLCPPTATSTATPTATPTSTTVPPTTHRSTSTPATRASTPTKEPQDTPTKESG